MLPRIMLVTDEEPDLEERVEEALIGGIRLVQLRHKNCSKLAASVRAITRKYGASLLINNHPSTAQEVQADGVHFPEGNFERHKEFFCGMSTHSLEAVKQAEEAGADYIVFGPIFPTKLKPIPQGLDLLKEVVNSTKLPVYAIGGINRERMAQCFECGAYGVAVQSNILSSKNCKEAAYDLCHS